MNRTKRFHFGLGAVLAIALSTVAISVWGQSATPPSPEPASVQQADSGGLGNAGNAQDLPPANVTLEMAQAASTDLVSSNAGAAQTPPAGPAAGAAAAAAALVSPWLGLISVVVPMLIELLKMLMPRLPSWSLPCVAPLLGILSMLALHYAGVTSVGVFWGAVLGSAGVGLRELANQLNKNASAIVLGARMLMFLGLPIGLLALAGCGSLGQTSVQVGTTNGTNITGQVGSQITTNLFVGVNGSGNPSTGEWSAGIVITFREAPPIQVVSALRQANATAAVAREEGAVATWVWVIPSARPDDPLVQQAVAAALSVKGTTVARAK